MLIVFTKKIIKIASIILPIFLLAFTVRVPELKKLESTDLKESRIIATYEMGKQFTPYFELSIARLKRFFGSEFPTGVHIYLADPEFIYEPYTRAQLGSSGGYAFSFNEKVIVFNLHKYAPLLSYKTSDSRAYAFVDLTLIHEYAHQWDFGKSREQMGIFTNSVGWKAGFPSLVSYWYIDKGKEVQTKYGLTNPAEDLAVTVEQMYSDPISVSPKRANWFRTQFRNSNNVNDLPR